MINAASDTSTVEEQASTPDLIPVENKPYTAPTREIWGWAAGRVSEFGLIATFGQAMNIFSVGFGLSPVIVGWCMMLPRLVDGVLDPIIGHWSDDAHTRWGRRKPFLIFGAFAGAIFLAILWWASPAWSPALQFTYLLLVGMCLYLCYGAYTMAWTAIGYELSDDYHERSRVAAIGGFVLAAMGLINSWIYWFALRSFFGGVIWGMRWIGGGMAVLVAVFAVITATSTRERFLHANRVHSRLMPALRTTLANRPFFYLILMKICEVFGGRLTGGVSFYLGMYYVCRGDQDLATRVAGIGATFGTIWNFAALPLVKPCSKLIGKRGCLILSTAIGLATSIAAPFITMPAHPYWGLIPTLIVTPLLVITSTIAGAILPDICDVDELQTGQRREGLYAAVMGFVSKLEISLAVVLVGYVVSWASLDTSLTNRWQATLNTHEQKVQRFVPGEAGTFELNNGKRVSVNSFGIAFDKLATTSAVRFEILTSDDSPTSGFNSIGTFDASSKGGSTEHSLHFATKARYFKIVLGSGSVPGGAINLVGFDLHCDDSRHNNLLSSESGCRLVAAEPPKRVTNRLYWLVMIPGIVFSFATFAMTLLFPLTEAKMIEVRRQLDEIHRKRQSS